MEILEEEYTAANFQLKEIMNRRDFKIGWDKFAQAGNLLVGEKVM